MNLEEFDIRPEFVLRSLLLVLAVVWMLVPGAAAAAYSKSAETSLVPFSGCLDFGFSDTGAKNARLKQTSSVSFSAAERRPAFTPCADSDRDSDPQYNICFEGNPASISTLPHLLAGLQAEWASSLVQSTAASILEVQNVKNLSINSSRAVTVLSAGSDSVPPSDRGATCSTQGDACSALPALPGGLDLASVVPVLLPENVQGLSAEFSVTTCLEQELWARLRIGPAVGHVLLVERPPIKVHDRYEQKS